MFIVHFMLAHVMRMVWAPGCVCDVLTGLQIIDTCLTWNCSLIPTSQTLQRKDRCQPPAPHPPLQHATARTPALSGGVYP